MRPIHLTVEGLRSFRSPAVPIDFTGRDHLAIVGDTGAGKSSILEAITYALYGQATFTAQGNQELMNDTSTHLRVVLRFRVSGETWEVARALRRGGQGKVGPASARLCRIGADDETVELVEQVKPVNERIKDLIGLDSDAFLRTVVLPQGRFARLLVEDKPTERGRILRQVWRTDELEAAGELAGAARQEATTLRIRLEQAASSYPEDPAAHLAQLEAAHGEAGRRAATASEDERAASTAREAVLAADKARQTASGVSDRLRDSGIERTAERLPPIRERARAFDLEHATLDRRQADLETEIARIPSDSDGPGAKEVASSLATLDGIEARATHAEAAAEDLRHRTDTASRQHLDARRKSGIATIAAEKTARHAQSRRPLAAAVEEAHARRQRVEQRHTACAVAGRDLANARNGLDTLRKTGEDLTARLDAARTAARRDALAADEAGNRLDAIRREHDDAKSAYPEERQRLRDASDAAHNHRQTATRLYEECRTRAEDVKGAEQRLATQRREASNLKQRLETAQSGEHVALRAQAEADAHLAHTRRSDSAAAAARDLHPGDECPVCARDLPHDWLAPAAAGLRDAEQAAQDKRNEADRSGRQVVALAAQLTGAGRQIDEAAGLVEERVAAFNTALQAMGAEVGTESTGSLPDPVSLLGPLDAAVRQTSEACDRHQHEHDTRLLKLDRSLGNAGEAHEAARLTADASGANVVDLNARLQGVEQSVSEATERIGVAERAFAVAMQALVEGIGTEVTGPLPAAASVLAPLDAELQEASDFLAKHDQEHQTLQAESSRLSSEAAAAGEAAAGADRLAEAARKTAAHALTQLHDAVASVAEAFRPRLDLPADPADLQQVDTNAVVDRIAAAQSRERILAQRATERTRLSHDVNTVNKERTALANRRSVEVDKPTAALVHQLQEYRFLIINAARDLEAAADVPGAVTPDDAEALESHIDALRTMTADLSRAAGEQAHAAAAQSDAARTALAAIGRRLDADTDVRDLDAIVDRARSKANDARFEERSARKSAEDFAAIIDDVRHLRTLLVQVEDKERALGDLEGALKPGAFLKWLTLRRSRRLLVHASRMLGEMSGGKYAFVDPGETEDQWRVLDRDSGQARSPASLSGGEQFIASLSLALGMVEMMARSGGRLESLFLDEGFGSLDRNNLDAAVQALGTVAAGGRMVGVISHVRAVAEQIEHVLAVTRGATGSKAEWLTNRQRQRLSESDTGWEAASALAGLLE